MRLVLCPHPVDNPSSGRGTVAIKIEIPPALRPEWFPADPYTFHELTPHLSEIVDSMPDGYVYERAEICKCTYWHEDQDLPGCIIGRLMTRLGAPKEFLIACDEDPKDSGLDSLINQGMLKGLFEERTGWALRHLQLHQDAGVPWYQALEMARSYWAGLRKAEVHYDTLAVKDDLTISRPEGQ